MKKKKIKDKRVFSNDWKNFKKAIQINDLRGVSRYGDMVLWNEEMTYENFVFMYEKLTSLDDKHSELEKLRLNVFNKKLNIERNISQYNF